ncbi:hypothetical protein J7T55_005456 [Diaporthe amygdali]|uniref:uncharacterized protein n=1 Tax=Phomopsis amygdali TaxID=1214568 RepID=UPI0022FECC1D|nr:uncharacterized protein J7T55_005456 [Diaporthe amygdali]KAJ0108913.1 hypothetical protein J7T55_005456 [Diaporthe amygdali]
MDQTREERMRSRMRGAARHQVQNADFGDLFAIPIIAPDAESQPEPEPEPEPEPGTSEPAAPSSEPAVPSPTPAPIQRISPNTSAKRRRLDAQGTAAPVPQSHSQVQPPRRSSSATRRSPRLSQSPTNHNPHELANAPALADEHDVLPKPTPPSRASATRASGSRSAPSLSAARNLPAHSSPLSIVQHAEEVGESPADQPGSGQRRRLRAIPAVTSSALLQSALRADDYDALEGLMPSSSPLTRKSRKSIAPTTASAPSTRTSLRRSTRLSGSSDNGVNALSSDMLAPFEDISPSKARRNHQPSESEIEEVEESVVDQTAADDAVETQAEEVDDREAARHLGRKRRRRDKAASPELMSEEVIDEPSAKRSRAVPPPKPKKRSPAKQKQPKMPRAKPSKQTSAHRKKSGDAAQQPISVKIQRFTKPRRIDEDDPEADDILNTEIPFANRGGVNAVDVLAQMCEELISTSLQNLKDNFDNAQDAATKKELRVKLRALEAFQEELRTRFLEHTIALDALYALKKRVREAQKNRLQLRERIMQIRAEREQVALRMDAVRMKHEEGGKEALHNIKLSAAMHDVDLAIGQGRAAPDLSAKDQKTAELANLELLIDRVTEQACSGGPAGGNLRYIKSFNAFLERTAAAL